MKHLPRPLAPAPLIEIRVGSLYLTLQRFPIRFATFLATLAGSTGVTLFIHR